MAWCTAETNVKVPKVEKKETSVIGMNLALYVFVSQTSVRWHGVRIGRDHTLIQNQR